MSTTPTKLNERNYRQCAIETKALLLAQGLWKYVSGEMRVSRPPIEATSDASTTPTARVPRDTDYDFLPESTDTCYLNQFYHFLRDWERWQMNNHKACRRLTSVMESTIQLWYRELTAPKQLWDTIKIDFEKIIKCDGRYEMATLTSGQLRSYPSFTEWISPQEKMINDLAVCDITIKDCWRKFYILLNLPNTEEWRTFATTLELTEKADTVASIITHIPSFEACLRRAQCLPRDDALFITKKGRGRHSKVENGNDSNSNDGKGDDWKSQVMYHECGVLGHIKAKCRSKHKWASNGISKRDANQASTKSTSTGESESFLVPVVHFDHVSVQRSDPVTDSTSDSVITVKVELANQCPDDSIPDTRATNHVTGNRHLFETFHPMGKREHQVKTANNSFVDAEATGTIKFCVDWPNAVPMKIVLQHVLDVPASGTNNLHIIMQLKRKGVKFDFKLDGATARLRSVLGYEAPLIHSRFVLRASTTSALVLKASVAVNHPPSTTRKAKLCMAYCDAPNLIPEISEASSNIWPAVDDTDIVVQQARLGHLSLPDIKRLPNAVRGIHLHARSP